MVTAIWSSSPPTSGLARRKVFYRLTVARRYVLVADSTDPPKDSSTVGVL
jgi:hypothetical protein